MIKLKRERGAVTLPSVDSWGVNNNILRDPPKSITTRRIDKVGQTSFLNDLIDESSDRMCEGIRVYSRGVNPSVSVDYTGNQVGLAGGMTSRIQTGSAKMPYKIMDAGAFRPPIRTERDLLPLSRLPRVHYNATAQPGLVNYAKTVYAPNDMRMIKDLIHGFDVKPNRSFQLAKPIEMNYKMDQAIQQPIHVSADSGYNSLENYERMEPDIDPNRYINVTPIHTEAVTNKSFHQTQGLDQGVVQGKQYIQHALQYETNAGFQPNEQRMGEMATPIQFKNVPNYQYTSNTSNSSIYKGIRHENTIQLERNLPQTSAHTQVTRIARFSTDNEIDQRRFSNLPERSKRGGFQNEGNIPRFERGESEQSAYSNSSANHAKSNMNKFVMSQQLNRYDNK